MERSTYVLVDGENIDATLGTSILSRRPHPTERPRWERLLKHLERAWEQPVKGLFFLAAHGELPMGFVQALLAIGYRPIPLSGGPDEKVVDIAISRTLEALKDRDADVVLASHDRDFVETLTPLVDGRRVTDVGRWAGTPRIVVGVGDAVSIDDDVADDDAGNAAGVGEA